MAEIGKVFLEEREVLTRHSQMMRAMIEECERLTGKPPNGDAQLSAGARQIFFERRQTIGEILKDTEMSLAHLQSMERLYGVRHGNCSDSMIDRLQRRE